MKNFTKQIVISDEQAGVRKLTNSANLTAYLLNPMIHALDHRRPAILICPGGGYGHLSDREAEPLAMQFLSMGYHAFVLHYSLTPDVFPYPQMELAKSISYIRSHASEWRIDADKIMVAGSSAGGHLACSIGAYWNQEFLYKPLNLTPEDIRPNGLILCYPVITSGPQCHAGSFKNLLGDNVDDETLRHLVSLECQVGSHTPKTFLWHTSTDQAVPVQNSLLLANALIENGVNLEMHIYPKGIHGLSLATEEVAGPNQKYLEPDCQSWITLLKTWLENF